MSYLTRIMSVFLINIIFYVIYFRRLLSYFSLSSNFLQYLSSIIDLLRTKMVDSQYYLPNDIGISALDCREAFRLLSPQEKMYAHYLSRAAW